MCLSTCACMFFHVLAGLPAANSLCSSAVQQQTSPAGIPKPGAPTLGFPFVHRCAGSTRRGDSRSGPELRMRPSCHWIPRTLCFHLTALPSGHRTGRMRMAFRPGEKRTKLVRGKGVCAIIEKCPNSGFWEPYLCLQRSMSLCARPGRKNTELQTSPKPVRAAQVLLVFDSFVVGKVGP